MRRQTTRKATIKTLSRKQLQVLSWWAQTSPVRDADGIIADGAIRSGKTLVMSLSFVFWAMAAFSGERFIMAGKTIKSFRRNVLHDLLPNLRAYGFGVDDLRGDNMIIVRRGDVVNEFYVFGGKDEASQDLVQGMTAAGAYLDEVVLMPESFVNQATGRLSVAGSKMWFNCNPGGPMHWFKLRWIDRATDKGLLHLHFTMDDNPSLTDHIKDRYKSMYQGVFYLRFIKGLWAVAEGLIYSMFTDEHIYADSTRPEGMLAISTRYIAVDYGTTNPCVFLDIRDDGRDIWVEDEWRWDSKSDEAGRLGNPFMTDAQYADAMRSFMTDDPALQCMIVADPSAKSFITELRNRGYYVKEGDNDVLDGIRKVSTLFCLGRLHIHERCAGLIKELRSYVWDEKAAQVGKEQPVKMQDHGPDALRYYIYTILPDWRTDA